MSNKDYSRIGELNHSVERLIETKHRLKRESNNTRPMSQRKRNLLNDRIYKTRQEENYTWKELHKVIKESKRKGEWEELKNTFNF